MSNNPFDWKNYTPTISMRRETTASKNSFQQTTVVNNRRAQGVEPSAAYSTKGGDTDPQRFVVAMPVMPYFDSTASERRRRRLDQKAKP